MSPEHRQAVADTILSLDQAFFAAAARLDADAMAGMLAETPYAAFAGGGEMMYTRDAAHASLVNGYGALSAQATEPVETRVAVLGPDAAVATGVALFSATDTLGTVSDGVELFTLVWARRDEGWRIVQSHFSSRLTRVTAASR